LGSTALIIFGRKGGRNNGHMVSLGFVATPAKRYDLVEWKRVETGELSRDYKYWQLRMDS
jgi:hypothetical protein